MIELDNPSCSRLHAILCIHPLYGLTVIDTKSSNGTFLGTKRLQLWVLYKLSDDNDGIEEEKSLDGKSASEAKTISSSISRDKSQQLRFGASSRTYLFQLEYINKEVEITDDIKDKNDMKIEEEKVYTVHVKDIAPHTTVEDLETFFKSSSLLEVKCEIKSIDMPKDRIYPNQNRGYALVNFLDQQSFNAALALDLMDPVLGGRRIGIKESKTKPRPTIIKSESNVINPIPPLKSLNQTSQISVGRKIWTYKVSNM